MSRVNVSILLRQTLCAIELMLHAIFAHGCTFSMQNCIGKSGHHINIDLSSEIVSTGRTSVNNLIFRSRGSHVSAIDVAVSITSEEASTRSGILILSNVGVDFIASAAVLATALSTDHFPISNSMTCGLSFALYLRSWRDIEMRKRASSVSKSNSRLFLPSSSSSPTCPLISLTSSFRPIV